jgi:hypothetical protein
MKKLLLLSISISLIFSSNLFSQDTLRIKQTITIKKGQELRIKEGTIVVFYPETRIWVEGGLKVIGTNEKPIQFTSFDANNPGIGISINGHSTNQIALIQNVEFRNLVQPVRFEPFWFRKNITINNISISNCKFSEAVIYVSSPLIDQRNQIINFELKNSKFYNNSSGLILEEIGSKNIYYGIDNLAFFENKLSGSDNSFGVFHLNLSSAFKSNSYKIGSLLFNRNQLEKSEIGLSVSGRVDSIEIGEIYYNNLRPVFDYYIDPRLPKIIFKNKNIKQWQNAICLINQINHEPGKIELLGSQCKVINLFDSAGNDLKFDVFNSLDTMILKYESNRLANKILFQENLEVQVPKIDNKYYLLTDSLKEIENKKQGDSILIAKTELFTKSFEIGLWGGFSAFMGDVKHKFGIPGCIEWTGGIYLQYNFKRNLSLRGTYYRTNIGMHDPTAALFMFQSAPFYLSDNNGNISQLSSWETSFKTKIHAIEFEAIWYLGNKTYLDDYSEKGRFISGIEAGFGIIHYTPYRGVVYSKYKDSAVFVEARPLGLEGQNFLPNKSKYGSIAMNFNFGFELNHIYKKWRIKSEFRYVITGTDYLDDIGTGYLYGGNYDEWLKSNSNWVGPINKFTGKPVKLEEAFQRKNPSSSKRTTDLLPDGYIQLHFGLSYNIGNPLKKIKK